MYGNNCNKYRKLKLKKKKSFKKKTLSIFIV